MIFDMHKVSHVFFLPKVKHCIACVFYILIFAGVIDLACLKFLFLNRAVMMAFLS